MALTIGDTTMTSDQSPHTARQVPGHRHGWEVTWLPAVSTRMRRSELASWR